MAIILKPQVTGEDDPRLWAQLIFKKITLDDVIIIDNPDPEKDETAIIDTRLRFHKPG